MKKLFIGLLVLVGLILLVFILAYPSLEEKYQADADVQRIEGLYAMADLIEAYYDETGHYPLSEYAQPGIYLNVLIGSEQQTKWLTGPPVSMSIFLEEDLEKELGSVLSYTVELPHDPQKVSTNGRPNVYEYNILDGYYYLKTYLHNPMEYSAEVSPHFNTFEVTSYPDCQPCDTIWTYRLLEK
jgi:hypothetical protein